MKPFAAFLLVCFVSVEEAGALGVPPLTGFKHLLWDGATPAHQVLLRAAAVGVPGPELADIRPAEAFDGRRRAEGASAWRGGSSRRPVCGAQRQRGSLLVRNQRTSVSNRNSKALFYSQRNTVNISDVDM
uniref:Uncharacterized protein n=1 Tax=Kryptolebias marmoratus TaxID=37003 RepID=A0A3Q3B5H3_KRYMA